jgi:biotin-(acetyl-CoA carboxylase) ligase
LDRVFHRILSCIEGYYLQLLANREAIVESAYLKHLYRLNQPSTFVAGGNQFEGTIRGVDINGRMLVEDNDGVKTYALKEVSFSY